MENIKEDNKHLVALRTNYFTMLFLVASGTAGIALAGINSCLRAILMLLGFYFIITSIFQIQNCTEQIKRNIERLRKCN